MEIIVWLGAFGVCWVVAAIRTKDYPDVWPFNRNSGSDDEPQG